MKAVMIIANQAFTEKVEYILDHVGVRGYTLWNDVKGRGSETGNPHLGTHTWPEINISYLSIVEEEKADQVLEYVRKLDETNKEVGIRAFVWDITGAY